MPGDRREEVLHRGAVVERESVFGEEHKTSFLVPLSTDETCLKVPPSSAQAREIRRLRERSGSPAIVVAVGTKKRIRLLWSPFASPWRYIDLESSRERMPPVSLVRVGSTFSTDVDVV